MSKQKDGGPIYPIFEARHANADYDITHIGMSLRDYFAAQALQGMISADHKSERSMSEMVTLAYKIADAMIAEREKQDD